MNLSVKITGALRMNRPDLGCPHDIWICADVQHKNLRDAPPGLGPPMSASHPLSGANDRQESATNRTAEPEISESTQELQRLQAERVDRGGHAHDQLAQAKLQGAAKQKLTERLQVSEKVRWVFHSNFLLFLWHVEPLYLTSYTLLHSLEKAVKHTSPVQQAVRSTVLSPVILRLMLSDLGPGSLVSR